MVEITEARKNEIYQDTVTYCDIILGILKDWKPTNDDPPGRIILECMWLKQEIENDRLAIPFYDEITSIRHTYVTSDMPDSSDEKDIYRYLKYIIKLSKNKLIVKPEHYPLIFDEIENLIKILNNAPRKLSIDEKNMLPELNDIKERISDTHTQLPIDPTEKAFTNIWKLYRYTKSTIDDIPEAHQHLQKMANMVFEAVRD